MACVFRWLPPRLVCLSGLASTRGRAHTGLLGSTAASLLHRRALSCHPLRWKAAAPLSEDTQRSKARQLQVQRPWLRAGADRPPVEDEPTKKKNDSQTGMAGAGDQRAKGKLFTTPNRLLKFTLPLPVGLLDGQGDGSTGAKKTRIEPLSLVLHPQQPISYVQRLIQAELPPIVDDKGRERSPDVYFWAEDTGSDQRTSKDNDMSADSHVATYSGMGREADERPDADKDWVRWGSSTEMGDFIREAARGREFAIRIEGYSPHKEVRVSVPSFGDRTYYQRMRLRRLSREVEHLAAIKRECDTLAHRSARNLAKGGFAALVGWWAVVYYVTFCTEYGWNLVEPVTYLASLTVILGGYFWFLFISRDLSYKAAMNVTVSRQQTSLYESRGFDVRRWERLVEEVNRLRAEVRRVAYEYDADWDEAQDLGSDKVKKVLEKEERREKQKTKAEDDGELEGADEAEESEEPEESEKSEKSEKSEGKARQTRGAFHDVERR